MIWSSFRSAIADFQSQIGGDHKLTFINFNKLFWTNGCSIKVQNRDAHIKPVIRGGNMCVCVFFVEEVTKLSSTKRKKRNQEWKKDGLSGKNYHTHTTLQVDNFFQSLY